MEAPQGVELTGTNGGKAIILHHPDPGWWPVLRPSDDSPRQGASGMRHKTLFRVHCPVPGPSRSDPPGMSRGRSTRFAAAMARVRRPVPFRTRKLRPCTAMVLHPRGCGRVARRRSTRYGSPRSSLMAPGGFLFFPPTHARAGATVRDTGVLPLTSPLIRLRSGIHPFLPLPPPFPPHIHPYPLDRIPIAGPRRPGCDDRGRGPSVCGGIGGETS